MSATTSPYIKKNQEERYKEREHIKHTHKEQPPVPALRLAARLPRTHSNTQRIKDKRRPRPTPPPTFIGTTSRNLQQWQKNNPPRKEKAQPQKTQPRALRGVPLQEYARRKNPS